MRAAHSATLTGASTAWGDDFMQGGTPERRKRKHSVRQTLHISDP